MSESAPAPRQLDDALKDAVRHTYTQLQANTPGFKLRRAQSQMIAASSASTPCCSSASAGRSAR